jgi:hypothetical protein
MASSNKSVTNVQKSLENQINKLRIIQLNDNGNASLSLPSFDSVQEAMGASLGSFIKTFEVQINPEKYQRQLKINYTEPQPNGDTAGNRNFNRIEGESLTLNFILDGTGVVPPSLTDPTNALMSVGFDALDSVAREAGLGGITDVTYVTRRVQELIKVVYDYNADNHEPPTVMVLWGDVNPFKGKLNDMQVTYTLFHASGAPLRAEIQLSFGEHRPSTGAHASATEGAIAAGVSAALGVASTGLRALISSPDLTHIRTVKQSDTLPLLSEEIYKDARYYWQVARANGLTHFRSVDENSDIYFPPFER